MKARVVVILMLVVGLMGASAHSFPPKRTDKGYVDAVTKGADIWIQLSVVDDDGVPIEGAEIKAIFSFRGGFRHVQCETGSDGNASIHGKTTGDEIVVMISKQGHYGSQIKTSYLRFGENRPVEDGKWQPWGESRKVIQLLQTGAHNYQAAQNIDQTLILSVIIAKMLKITHGQGGA